MALARLRKLITGTTPKQVAPVQSSIPTAPFVPDPLADRILPDAAEDSARPNRIPGEADARGTIDTITSRIEQAQSWGEDPAPYLEAVTFGGPTSETAVVNCLQTYGLAIFPAIYDADRLARIHAEYDDLIENGAELARDVNAREETPAHSYAISVLRNKVAPARFPETQALFGSEAVERIARRIFAGQSFDYNADLYVQWTDHTDVPASGALHWDKQLTLKSWLYITDATEGHGAMRAGAGTAAWLRYVREDAMFDGIPYAQINNRVEESGFPVISTGGPAGTFFLFMTDTAHGATPVDAGKRRNIIRARSRAKRITEWASWASKL